MIKRRSFIFCLGHYDWSARNHGSGLEEMRKKGGVILKNNATLLDVHFVLINVSQTVYVT